MKVLLIYMSFKNDVQSDDEVIPPAPAFCQRFTKEEAERMSKQLTADSMLQLGAKIQSDIVYHKEQERRSGLKELDNSIRLSELLNEYFELDSQGQKARMLELFTEIEKLKKINNQYKATIDTIQREYEQEKFDREEFSEQCDVYIEELDEKDEEIKNLKHKYKETIAKLEELQIMMDTKAKNNKQNERYYRVRITQLSMVIAGFGAYFFSPVLQYLF